ncbi:glutamate--tRNA ligase [Pseudofulvimonas gallinarii]|uniref:Glutamate--tRNA ligase n=1 Tax=Pseudofulvimonas gallinarii TaxID=634155 RepID=A0A4S3KUV1_9GAMM|nr:glutamate--tRNA ligase [Pseudofulvimonas gallinarii]TCS94068.1 glutamyl-tRNA synthetase [Pseudofulvimonas gallinarii]THD12992.1 glutamate--tRNA ligase [Pseudofulvimonas gallinarii]
MTVRTRFAPSPTGYLHIGGARTALYCYLEARHRGGQFILRVEDTDRERSTDEAVQAILQGMEWLGLEHDEGPFYQTQRMERYHEVAQGLVAAGKAYYAYESREELDAMRAAQMEQGLKPRYNGRYRDDSSPPRDDPNRVIRFKNPKTGSVVFEDRVKGRIEWSNEELDDLIIWRSDGFPTYNFAVVVDDIDMGITDVIRGDDHVNNTPRQINLYEALGAKVPAFSHLPMILGPDGQKLSKRHGAVSVLAYREDGFLPDALLNYLVRLGWSHGDKEVFSREEMVELFSVADVNVAAARFDLDKLKWLNQQYLMKAEPDTIAPLLEKHLRAIGVDPAAGPATTDVVVAMRERAQTLAEMAGKSRHWYAPLQGFDEAAAGKHLVAAAAAPLRAVHAKLAAVDDWRIDTVHAALVDAAAELQVGMGKVAQPLRVAITGSAASPSIDVTVYLAGRDRALQRIDDALARISGSD